MMSNNIQKRLINLTTLLIICAFFILLFLLFSVLQTSDIDISKNPKESVEFFVNKTNDKLKTRRLRLKDGVYEIQTLDTTSMLFKPDFGWIKINDAKISEYALYFLNLDLDVELKNKIEEGTYYTNCCVQKIGDNIYYEELPSDNVVNVKDFGAKGDISKYLENSNELIVDVPQDLNITPLHKASIIETTALQKAVEEVNKTGGILYFPHGTYHVSVNDFSHEYKNALKQIFTFNNTEKIIVDLGLSTIKQVGYSNTNIYNFPSVNVFLVNGSENIEIKNGTIIGDRQEHDYSDWLPSDLVDKNGNKYADTHEFGYGIFFFNTKRGIAKNLKIKEFTGDAIVIKNGAESQKTGSAFETIIEDCELSYCRRQGVSVLDSDKNYIKNCTIHDIGHTNKFTDLANNGTAPMSGIDVEPGSGSKKVNLLIIDNSKIYNCTGGGLISAVVYINNTVEVYNSHIENPSIHGALFKDTTLIYKSISASTKDTVSMKCCEFENVDFKFINWSKKHLSLSFLTPQDIEIRDLSTDKQSKLNNCRFYTDVDNKNESVCITFSECKEINNITFENFLGYIDKNNSNLFGIYIVTKQKHILNSIIFKNCDVSIKCSELKNGQFDNCFIYMPDQSNSPFGVSFENITFNNCNLEIKSNNNVSYLDCIFNNCKSKIEKHGIIVLKYEKCNKEPDSVDNFTS